MGDNKVRVFLNRQELGNLPQHVWGDPRNFVNYILPRITEVLQEEYGVELKEQINVSAYLNSEGLLLILAFQDISDEDEDTDFFLPPTEFFPQPSMFPGMLDSGRNEHPQKTKSVKEKTLVFWFADFDDLANVVLRLRNLGYAGGDLYYYDGKYYLLLTLKKVSNTRLNFIDSLLAEYGNRAKAGVMRIKEYGKPIVVGKAIKTIAHRYFAS